MITYWHNRHFKSRWRIPGVRKYAIEFDMDLGSWLIGVMYYQVGFAVELGPFAILVERRCDCCP
jgi:hypothetical protein